MLEGPSYLISRELPTSIEQECKWIYNTHCIIEFSSGEPQMEAAEADPPRKVSRALETHGFSPSETDDQHSQGDYGNNSEFSPQIDRLGRDVSLNCLVRCSRSDYGAIACLNRAFRSLIRSGELYKLRRDEGFIEHWIYFSCSLLEWEAYDPNRGRWLHVPKMTWNDCFVCSDKESLAVGTELLVFGVLGFRSHVIYRYSILTNAWSPVNHMNTPRCLFGSASFGGTAILAGGCDPRGTILSSAEIYDSDTGEWTTIPSMNKARKMCSGVFMDGKFYIIGGTGVGSSRPLTCGEVYDFRERTWTVIPDMLPTRNVGVGGSIEAVTSTEAPPLVAVVRNELYAADYMQREVRKYNKHDNSWTALGKLPESAVSLNGWGIAFRACGDQLIVVGGPRTLTGGGVIEINAWQPDSQGPPRWTLLDQKPLGSFVYNCAIMGC